MLSEDLKRKIRRAVQVCVAENSCNGEPLKDIHDCCDYSLDEGLDEIYSYEDQYLEELVEALRKGRVNF